MAVIPAPSGATHELPGTRFTSLATPSRGTVETAVWRVEIDAGVEPTSHSLTREEVFVVLEGTATVEIDGEREVASRGDAIAVPAETPFVLANGGDGALRLLCCLPVGGQARMGEQDPFTPPWAQ